MANYGLTDVIIVNIVARRPRAPCVTETIIMLNVLFKSMVSVEGKKMILKNTYNIAMSDDYEQEVGSMSGLAQSFVSLGEYNMAVEIAKRMIMAREPMSQITKFINLDQGTIETLAEELGVILPDPVEPS